ncbi:hypothetical protein ACNUIP_32140 [Pseudomonas aeruginosa]
MGVLTDNEAWPKTTLLDLLNDAERLDRGTCSRPSSIVELNSGRPGDYLVAVITGEKAAECRRTRWNGSAASKDV